MSSSCVPLSTTSPSRRTRILSAFLIVDRRCAITKLVRPFVSSSMARWIKTSVRVSTEEVASSRISMGAFWSIARAMVRSCFCPAEMPALSESTVSNPCGSEWMSLSSPHARQTASSCSSVMPSMLYTRFSRTVPSKSQVSCKTMLKRPCTSSRRISEMGTPSIVMLPLLISKNRMRRLTIVVLPAPVGPTMATFCPGSTSAEKSRMMILSGSLG